MSRLGRLRQRLRLDASYRVPPSWQTSATGKNKPPTYVPYLIENNITHVDDLGDLGEVARHDPYANHLTYGMANDALGDWFQLVDKHGKEVMEDALQELKLLRAKQTLILALAYERAYGWSYIYAGKNRFIPKTPKGGRIASLHAFTPEECVVKKYDDVGVPVTMELTVNVGEGEYSTREMKITLPAEDFIFVVTRPLPNNKYQGRSVLEPVFSPIMYSMYTYNSMSWYDMKVGQGVFMAKTKDGIPNEWKAQLNTSLEDISVRRAWVIDGSIVDEVGYVQASAGATDFPAHQEMLLWAMAAGSGLPQDSLTGVSGGTNEAATSTQKAKFKEISEIQGDIEPFIDELIEKAGFELSYDEYYWNARYATSDEEQSKIDMNKAQTLAIKSGWWTINELRKEEGLPPLPDGDKLMSEFSISVQGLNDSNPAEQRDQTQNEEGTQL